ncbi:MAG: hypothetical protein D6712_17435 [Chloroflexi bacterium]|nr:MAG: hypothetical protein D6712_17435 [Chloroflexota bacterium]
MQKVGAILLVLGLLVLGALAQDDGDDMDEGALSATAWLLVAPDAPEDAEALYVLFVPLDEGALLLEVAAGEDVLYSWDEELEAYHGAPFIPDDAYDFESTLVALDDDTYESTSVTKAGALTFERVVTFERTELEYELWTEVERDLTEYTMFGECLGAAATTPPKAWATPDPILPVRIDDEEGVLYLGNTVLGGGAGEYILEEEAEFGTGLQQITQVATVTEDAITLEYYAVVDGRDDCELRFTATYAPFDGDFEALFERVSEMAEAE